MKKISNLKAFLVSFFVHALMVSLVLVLILRAPVLKPMSQEIQLVTRTLKLQPQTRAKSISHVTKKSVTPKLDLRPSFMKDPLYFSKQVPEAKPSAEWKQSDLLSTPTQVTRAFDHLADQINRNLDFPDLLIENGIQGNAVLDLQFDEEGKISESKSNFYGDGRSVRGLLVKAARLGLVEWYHSDAYRLHRDEFRNQHFQAAFEISYTQEELSNVVKLQPNAYQMNRRHYRSVCANPMGVDLICLAQRAKGVVQNVMNDNNRIKFDLLKDRLEHYDDIGLNGINDLIHQS